MKKCICIILVIVVSILSGCNSSQNEENVFPQNLKEYYEVSPYENATFFIENNSDKEYHCSESYFEIETEESDVWYQLTQLSDPSKNNEDDVIIKPSERLRLAYDISSFYGELPSGHYRIIISVSYFESPKDWDYDTYYLACEFTIK